MAGLQPGLQGALCPRQAVEWRTQAEEGKLELAEYERMLKT